MAEDVATGSSTPRPAAEPVASRSEQARTSAYYTRFTFAYTLLGIVAAAAIGALIVVLLRPESKPAQPWSKFVPTGSALDRTRQIATQVSREYKQSTTGRLVSVFPGPLQATQYQQSASGQQTSVQVPISAVAVQPDTSTGQHEAGDYTFYNPSSTVAYAMCGFGNSTQNCGVASITGSNPTALLHREALELALYTLRYVQGTNAVIAYLPPPSNPQAAATAILIARKDVSQNLGRPLARTIRPQQILLGSPVPDAGRVAHLTASRIYTTNYQTLPSDGSAVLVLSPANTG